MEKLKEKISKVGKKSGGLLTEFKEFAMKGNVIDMAVGVVIGAAFGKIVTSLVNDIIMPLISVVTLICKRSRSKSRNNRKIWSVFKYNNRLFNSCILYIYDDKTYEYS